MIYIRPENIQDTEAIFNLHCDAFQGDEEARLVNLLRDRNKASLSFIAEHNQKVIGHILFSPVEFHPLTEGKAGLGLAPLSVSLEYRQQGIAASLVQECLQKIKNEGYSYVTVLGNASYYQRFGFIKASILNIQNEYGADTNFMIMEIKKDSLPKSGGLIRYASEFSEVGF